MTSEGSAAEPIDENLGHLTDARVLEVLVLSLGDAAGATQCAIPAATAREVARVDRVTAYPGAPVDVGGVAAIRGHIVVVLDLVPSTAGERVAVLLTVGTRTLALAGATPVRVVAAHTLESQHPAHLPGVRLWSGRMLPCRTAVRLLDGTQPELASGVVLPLLDAAALIDDVLDDSDGER